MPNQALSLEALDASNRVFSLLAGASSQSFEQIGYGFAEGSASFLAAEPTAYFNGLSSESSFGAVSSEGSSGVSTLTSAKAVLESLPGALAPALDTDAVAAAYSDGFALPETAQPGMDDQLIWGGTPQSSLGQDFSDSLVTGQTESASLLETSSLFVSDLLTDLIDRLSSEKSLESDFDGEKQAAIRDFLNSVGSGVEDTARDFFQSNVQGQLKGITGEAVDGLGVDAVDPVVDPIQSFDYYGTSADFIQDTRDTLSLSSVALPAVGPGVEWLADSLSQRLNA